MLLCDSYHHFRRKMDRASRSDPFVVIKMKRDTDNEWKEIGEFRSVAAPSCRHPQSSISTEDRIDSEDTTVS